MLLIRSLPLVILCIAAASMARRPLVAAEPLRVLILDGENGYHDWRVTTPIILRILRDSGRFVAEVATFPEPGSEAAEKFRPALKSYDVVLSNYNSQTLPNKQFQGDLVDYVRSGGGLVIVHAASNAWAHWPEFNELCGLGGWYDRNEKWGPYVYYKDDKLVRDESPGTGGHHGEQHEFVVRTRQAEHPIMKGLPAAWKHAKDELYDQLRGPAENMEVLATAWSDLSHDGTGRDEPSLMVLEHGKGRVFHTTLGHADYSMACVGFITTLLRGTEWAASGEVTIPVPENFPTEEKVSSRE